MLRSDSNLDFSFLKEVHAPKRIGRQAMSLIGHKFGRLTPLGMLGITAAGAKWLCRCDCGSFSIPVAAKLLQGRTISCGCYGRSRLIPNVSHRMSRTRVYRLWCDMHTRASNPRFKQFSDYGGRGISVSERWHTFESFFEDMGQPPTVNHSIERRDNNLGYSPENCYWATKKQQARNTRANRRITINGETRCIAEWAEQYRISARLVYERLNRGWTPEQAVGLVVKDRWKRISR